MDDLLLEVAATKQGKATEKRVVQPTRPKSNLKPSKRAWAVYGGIVVSDVLLNVAQHSLLPGIYRAAQAALMFFTTIEVRGGTSFIVLNLELAPLESPSQQRRFPDHR